MIVAALLSLVGFALLFFGADWLVSGASALADRLGLSKAFAGLVLVALGTSAPELFVNLIAALDGRTAFALSNVAGSNLTNVCVGFGLIGVASSFAIPRRRFAMDGALMVLSSLVVLGALITTSGASLPFLTLLPLAGLLVVFVISLFRRRAAVEDVESPIRSALGATGMFLLGGLTLYVGGEVVFAQALRIAERVGMSESMIAFTLVAAGTSIPDVTASVVAARRAENEIAIGNLVGSNISNVLVVLSGTLLAAGGGLEAEGRSVHDFVAVTIVSLITLMLLTFAKRMRAEIGIGLLLAYAAYVVWRVWPSEAL